jgi:hypothetical protein
MVLLAGCVVGTFVPFGTRWWVTLGACLLVGSVASLLWMEFFRRYGWAAIAVDLRDPYRDRFATWSLTRATTEHTVRCEIGERLGRPVTDWEYHLWSGTCVNCRTTTPADPTADPKD